MNSILQVGTVLWLIHLLSFSSGYELQDTIHTLKEENFHLQHQLENLTQALRDLKHLLTEHSKGESRDNCNEGGGKYLLKYSNVQNWGTLKFLLNYISLVQ